MKLHMKNLIPGKGELYRIAVLTVLILLIPLIAMQFTDEVNWNKIDFLIMGLLVFCFSNLFIIAARAVPRRRVHAGIILAAVFFYVWVELAVGVTM